MNRSENDLAEPILVTQPATRNARAAGMKGKNEWPRVRAALRLMRSTTAAPEIGVPRTCLWGGRRRFAAQPEEWIGDLDAWLGRPRPLRLGHRRFQVEKGSQLAAERPPLLRPAQAVRIREERCELALLSVLGAIAVTAVAAGLASGTEFAWRLETILEVAQRVLG